ncbi:hypothetical protein [Brachybacterium sp.]|uniref:hypothetical protein n=1 Tax=Brachybacterium sp. TaxID=1891286 RepID=UPI002ED0E65D
MTNEIEVIRDGDGLAVIGAPGDVDAFLTSFGFEARELELHRLGPSYKTVAGALNAGAGAVANSGRWMKLTPESLAATKALPLVKNVSSGNLHATLRASNGQFAKNLQFVTGPVALLNPAALAAAGAIMSQMAMQEAIEEIGEYLAVIDEKVGDVLRAQKDSVFADMIGADLMIEEAMVVRDEVGRVSEVTWSKIQNSALTLATTEAYALRQIDAQAEKVEEASVPDLAAKAKAADSTVREWLAVLARCVQLQDALAVLELDRVLDSSPEELDRHRLGLRTAREKRLSMIHRTTEQLLERMNTTIRRANAKVLLSPRLARAAVSSSNLVVGRVLEFQTALEIEDGHDSTEAKRWRAAAGEMRDKVVRTGVDGAGAAIQFGGDTAGRVRSGAGRLSDGARAFREAVRREDSEASDEPAAAHSTDDLTT